MPKHFLKCDLVKTTPFDKEPVKKRGTTVFFKKKKIQYTRFLNAKHQRLHCI